MKWCRLGAIRRAKVDRGLNSYGRKRLRFVRVDGGRGSDNPVVLARVRRLRRPGTGELTVG